MKTFFEEAIRETQPLRVLIDFLKLERAREQTKQYDQMRFVGYVLKLGMTRSQFLHLTLSGLP